MRWTGRTLLRSLSLLAGIAAFAMPASAVEIAWVGVDDPDNAPDEASNCFARHCGSVSNFHWISAFEVTNANYAEFLNAKARTAPLGLYNTSMFTNPQGGITRSFIPGSFVYAEKPGFENKPVNFVSFFREISERLVADMRCCSNRIRRSAIDRVPRAATCRVPESRGRL